MPLSNQQYDSIMREYKQKQIRADEDLTLRTQEIYEAIPEYRALDEAIADFALKETMRLLSGEAGDINKSNTYIDELSLKKKELLLRSGYPEDYLTIHYECPDCHDTGFIGNEKCHCFIEASKSLLEANSNLRSILKDDNFSNISYKYYEGEDLERFKSTVDRCHKFVDNFDSQYENLLFYGTVGTGKSFLSGCIARELIISNHSVMYYSAGELFKLLTDVMFDRGDRTVLEPLRKDIYNADLLIIDDLGTELTNSATVAELFSLINERNLFERSTIISTNLGFQDLQERYADRIFSRLLEQYSFYKFSGPDIRRIRKIDK